MVKRHDYRDHNRRSIRLRVYDYTAPGPYFITICTCDGVHLLGDVKDGTIHLSEMGDVVARTWCDLARHRPGVVLDQWVVMPNHFHGIIALPARDARTIGVALAAWRARHPVSAPTGRAAGRPRGPTPRSLGAIVGAFKSATTRQINLLRSTPGLPVWQRGYYERIIGDDSTLASVRRYIEDNPRKWVG
jgi:REP element-mobilizing transposase RayT